MDIASQVQTIAKQALAQLSGVQETATFTHYLEPSYDPTTGEVTISSVDITLFVTFGNYTDIEIQRSQGEIRKSDRKALITPDQFAGEITEPNVGDLITRSSGEAWLVMEGGIELDPARALYMLWTRKEAVSNS